MSMIFTDSDTLLHESLADIQNKINFLNINSNLKNSIHDDLQQIQKRILLQQHKLSLLTKHNILGLISWNTAFEITDWDENAANIFGYTKQEALGCHAASLLVPETVRTQVNQIMSELLKQEGGVHSINENVTKNGNIITCKWYNLVVKDLNSNVIGVIAAVEDITASKAMEIALNRSEARFKNLVANVPGVIYQFILDTNGTISFPYISDACQELFGIEPEKIVQNGNLITNAVYSEDYDNFINSVIVSAKTLERWNWEGRIIAGTGELKWIRGISRPELLDSGAILWEGLLIDTSESRKIQLALEQSQVELESKVAERTAHLQQEIFERKAVEIELQETLDSLKRTQSQLVQTEKMSSLGQLVAGVAHEINNPVNFIYGNLRHAQTYTQDLLNILALYNKHYPKPNTEILNQAEVIDVDFIKDDLPKLYNSMQIGASRIREIVASLRTFSRLDEAECKQANIHEGIDSTLMILEHRLKAKQNRPEITVIKEYGNLPLIECYAGQLNQVFMNLIANAIDALEEGIKNTNLQSFTPCINIRTELSTSNQVIISIADNGVGIPEKVKHKLFDPFYTTKPVGKGTGMGLSISYQIITERHDGSLKCVSAPSCGAEFIITIPVSANNFSIRRFNV